MSVLRQSKNPKELHGDLILGQVGEPILELLDRPPEGLFGDAREDARMMLGHLARQIVEVLPPLFRGHLGWGPAKVENAMIDSEKKSQGAHSHQKQEQNRSDCLFPKNGCRQEASSGEEKKSEQPCH